MKRTIIYVFGPKRIESDYFKNGDLKIESGGWLKIGMTNTDDKKDKWEVAKERCEKESRTGLCETCKLFDVFEYPEIAGKPDDELRQIMSDEIYELNTSKNNNKLVDASQYEIKAGQEFVYGASRKHVLSAVAKFERNLMVRWSEEKDDNKFKELIKMITNNLSDCSGEIDEEEKDPVETEQTKEADEFFNKLLERLPEDIRNISKHSPRRTYMHIKNSKNNSLNGLYCAKYLVRHMSTRVTFETFGGEKQRDIIEKFIEDKKIRDTVKDLIGPIQGSKNKEKYYWEVVGEYAGRVDEVIQWFVDNITMMYNAFEQKG